MKKVLLLACAVVASLSASAQAVTIDGKAWATANGSTDEGANAWGPIAAGVEMCKIDGAAVMSNGAPTNFKVAGSEAAGYDAVWADGMVVDATKQAIQGQDNPKDEDGGTGWSTFKAPTTGAFTVIEALKDGYLAVIAKYSSNKNYTVFEEGSCIPYTFAIEWSDGGVPAANPLTYTLPGVTDAEGIVTYDQEAGPINWPEQIVLGAESAIKKNGLGVIIFPVYADCKYNCNAWGSKIAPQGMIFSETPFSLIKVQDLAGDTAKEDFVIYNADPSGIKNVNVAKASTGFYNIAGQKINSNFKGLAIQNGKKVVKK